MGAIALVDFEKGLIAPIDVSCRITGKSFSEALFFSTSSISYAGAAWGWGPLRGSFLTSSGSALTLRSKLQAWGANRKHDPEGGKNTKKPLNLA